MSKVLELCEGIELNVAYGMDPKYLTLTKIIRLQHETIKFYADTKLYELNVERVCGNDRVFVSGNDDNGTRAKQALAETNRIASGSEGDEK
jgi:hypothetical protein